MTMRRFIDCCLRMLPLLMCCLSMCCGASAPLPVGPGKQVAVFVALCDNEHQGIAPVPAAIGNGDDPERNLYWGCSDALPRLLRRSKDWGRPLVPEAWLGKPEAVLRTLVCTRVDSAVTVTAYAWRGDAMQECLEAFEAALVSGKFELVVFLGHNGLMDEDLPEPAQRAEKAADAMVLCCLSQEYFSPRLEKLGSRAVLTTRQFMYPAGQVVLAALDAWMRDANDLSAIHHAAGKAYAANQKISLRAGKGVFHRHEAD